MKVKTLANYIVHQAIENGQQTTSLKLNKLLYILQLTWLKVYHQPLILEQFEIWAWGPCLPSVYYEYCGHGAMPISFPHSEKKPELEQDMTPEQIELINLYIRRYADCCPWDYEPEWFGENSIFAQLRTSLPSTKKENVFFPHLPAGETVPNSLLAELVRNNNK